MSLFGSLFAGVSGLSAQSQAMAMISDNVANVNTTAYKRASAAFSTLLINSGAAAPFAPGGVRSYTSYSIGNQGLLQSSASPTHVSISGSGFFVVNSQADGTGEQLYTRAGAFESDYLGNLRSASGFYVQGWLLDAEERVVDPNRVETVNLQAVNGVAKATTEVEVRANLDAGEAAYTGAYAAGDMALWNATGGTAGVGPQFNRAIQVFDSLGAAHNVTLAVLKSPMVNEWYVELYADPTEVDPTNHPNGRLAAGTLTFDGDGALAASAVTPVFPGTAAVGDPIGIDWSGGAADSSIAVNLGTVGATEGLRQFDAGYDVSSINQNGAAVGDLNGVSIDEEGYVIASFSNGQKRKLYKLPVSTFTNPGALQPRTGNVYAQSEASGEANLRDAGRGNAGTISPSSLEAANVDLADEFTKMIVTQRAYSANARIITTTDEMLDELIRISR